MNSKKLNKKSLRKNAWKFSFKKGFSVWILLVSVCFIFSFIGSSNQEQTAFLDATDSILGFNTEYIPKNTEVLTEYVINSSTISKIPLLSNEFVVSVINSLSKSHTWFVNLLAANFAYFERNSGEVIVSLLIVSLITFLINIFIQNTFNVGKARYFMENRYSKKVKIGRIFAPFHKRDILHITSVMVRYRISLLLWYLTIIGGFYKHYQYRMIPYLLAENPKLTWKQVKNMSIKMTKGYKWQMFLTEVSSFYIFMLKGIPVIGLLVALPYEECLNAEFYFTLRNNIKDDDIFIEKAFNDGAQLEEPMYLMKDVIVSPKELRKNISSSLTRKENKYNAYDYIFFFFAFCFVGWVWEVLLHFVKHYEFVNRGTMYGPWLPIYGCGGVLIIFLLNKFKKNKFKLFFLTILVCAILEYASSWILDFFYNSSYWDYKQMFMNINGRICLAGLIAFGLGGQFGIYIAAPYLSNFLDKLGIKKTKILCFILIVLFVIDEICCLIFGLNTGSGVGGTF